jgi:hypothetical protein
MMQCPWQCAFIGRGQPVAMAGVVPGRLQEQLCFGGFVIQDRVLVMDHGDVCESFRGLLYCRYWGGWVLDTVHNL